MELNTILELVKAGFTKDEIMQMAPPTSTQPNPEPVPTADTPITPTPEPTPVQTQVAEPVAVPTPQPVQQETQPTMAELMQSIAKLTSAVQANAIASSILPNTQNRPSAEDMLAEIIRPSYQERRT